MSLSIIVKQFSLATKRILLVRWAKMLFWYFKKWKGWQQIEYVCTISVFPELLRISEQFLVYRYLCLEMAVVLQIKANASRIRYLILPPLDEETTRLSCRDKVSTVWYDAPKCIGVPGEAVNLRIRKFKLSKVLH